MEKLSDWNKKETGDISGLFAEGETAEDVLGKKQASEHQNNNSPELPAKNEAIAEYSDLTKAEISEFMTEVAEEQKARQLTLEMRVSAWEGLYGYEKKQIVSSAWKSLNHYERRFVTAPKEQFDKLIDEYEASHSTKRRNLITGLRKLIESGSPLAADIEPEPKWEEAKEKEKKAA